jgi:hypothetical protein
MRVNLPVVDFGKELDICIIRRILKARVD